MAQENNKNDYKLLFCAFMACNVDASEHNYNGTCKCLSCHPGTMYCNNGCSWFKQLMEERLDEPTSFDNRCIRCMKPQEKQR